MIKTRSLFPWKKMYDHYLLLLLLYLCMWVRTTLIDKFHNPVITIIIPVVVFIWPVFFLSFLFLSVLSFFLSSVFFFFFFFIIVWLLFLVRGAIWWTGPMTVERKTTKVLRRLKQTNILYLEEGWKKKKKKKKKESALCLSLSSEKKIENEC